MTLFAGSPRRFKAAFFDRDNTLTYPNPEKINWRRDLIESWSGRTFDLDYDRMVALYEKAGQGRTPWYRDVAEEQAFFLRYYRLLLQAEGVTSALVARSKTLFDGLWCNNDRLIYPEVVQVLTYFQDSGYRMGVISDTSPSLELTLRHAGLAQFFTSFTASSLVGAMKPSPVIFNAALAAQKVTAQESLYVDDYDVEADGAREQGFTAFLIDRQGPPGPWKIQSLCQMVDYVKANS